MMSRHIRAMNVSSYKEIQGRTLNTIYCFVALFLTPPRYRSNMPKYLIGQLSGISNITLSLYLFRIIFSSVTGHQNFKMQY